MRLIAGAIGAIVVALIARRMRTLSSSGAVAAAIVGTISIVAGLSWGILLIAYFISASALSKLGERKKADIVGPIVEKGARRDAIQVLANGVVYAAAAAAYLVWHSRACYAIGIGALAASAADTWATEIGTLAGRNPILIISGRRVPPGTSGGVSLPGMLASAAGALFVATGAALARWPVPFTAIVVGGLAGAVADSVLGATLQARRWCDVCAMATERSVHDCGSPTRRTGGLPRLDNDAVNAVCSGVGALVTLLLS